MSLLASLVLASCSDSGGADEDRSAGAGRADGAQESAAPWWEEFTAASGVDFQHASGAVGDRELPEIMGAGVAVFDADADGDLDLYFTNGAYRAAPAGGDDEAPTDRFFRQVAAGRFEDATDAAGLANAGYGMGVAVGDIDNDGDIDLYVTGYGQGSLYVNAGDGTFTDRTVTSGIVNPGWSSSSLFFDYDRDGFLDLFVVRYVAFDPEKPCHDRAGRPDYCGPTAFPAVSDQLFHNEGDGTFREVSAQAGLTAVQGAGLGVTCRDFDGDGWLDVAVANDAHANHLWINSGDGRFEELAFQYGFAFNQHGQAEAGMGIVTADFDGDLAPDVFLTHLGVETNTLYQSVGTAGFRDATGRTGLAAASMPFTGFGTVAIDGDQDGDLDLLVANGRVVRGNAEASRERGGPAGTGGTGQTDSSWDLYREPNQMFVNAGDARFREARPGEGGDFVRPLEISRALAAGDLDGDGDLDLVLANIEGGARLYRNVHGAPGHWLQVRAVDPALKRDALGAVVTVTAQGARYVRTVDGQGGYLSSSSFTAHFGLAGAAEYERVEVLWPGGEREVFPGGATDVRILVERGTGSPAR